MTTHQSRPRHRAGRSLAAAQRLAVDARMMVIVVGGVIVMIDGDEARVLRIRTLRPAEALLHEEEREDCIAMGRQPLASVPLDVVVFHQHLKHRDTSGALSACARYIWYSLNYYVFL